MWLFTEWQQFNAQLEFEENRAHKFREYTTLNEKISQKNGLLEGDVESALNNNSKQNTVKFTTNYCNQDAVTAKEGAFTANLGAVTAKGTPVSGKGAIPKHQKEEHIRFSERNNISDLTDDSPGRNNKDCEKDLQDDVFQPNDAVNRKSVLYRVGLGIIAIVACVCLLSMPTVPERFLGIRSPQRVLMEYRLTPHPGNDSVLHPVEVNQSHPHSVHKRHAVRVPHKFWAKARPHNKFKKKKHAIPQVAAPVPNPYIIKRH